MKHLIRFTDLNPNAVQDIFRIADHISRGGYAGLLKGKTAVLFFPDSSIRTRVTFEKGIYLLGGQAVLFPPEALDKKEDLRDVAGYLNNWADLLIVRHRDIRVTETIADYAKVPVINAMTSVNHPCEMLSDLYALSKIRKNLLQDKFLFCGTNGNIGRAWKEVSDVLGIDLEQCCAEGYELDGIRAWHDLREAVAGKDIVCTDSLPASALEAFKGLTVTKEIMDRAGTGAVLNPCPPFYRGEDVSEDVIRSDYFVGYAFKKSLLPVQQAVMVYCLTR